MMTRVSESVASDNQRLRTTDRIRSFLSKRSHGLKRSIAPIALTLGLIVSGAVSPGSSTSRNAGQPALSAMSSVFGTPAAAAGRDRLSSRAASVSMTTINRAIVAASRRYGVETALIRAIVRAESRFENRTLSSAGAMGLMQIMPSTARNLGVSNPWDPHQNVMAGTRLLRWLLSEFGGNTRLAVAAYNAGDGAVKRHGGVPPFTETQRYVQKVLAFRAQGG